MEFIQTNPCNDGGKLVDEHGCYTQPENIYGEFLMLENGVFTVNWPLLNPTYKSYFTQEQLNYILGLRARWCALFEDSIDYRNGISQLLLNNDRKNTVLNKQLREWNNYLSTHGFEIFDENDLRGVNLSGLDLDGNNFGGINLAHIDLSYSDFSVGSFRGVYLYKSKLEYSNGLYCDMSMSILDQSSFKHSMFSHSCFQCSSFSFSKIVDSIFFNSNFAGAILENIDVSGSSFSDATFQSYGSNDFKNSKPCKIDMVIGNENTVAPFEFKINGGA